MKIILNNRTEEFDAKSMIVNEMIMIKKFSFRLRIIKINGTLIPAEKYGTTYISDGDIVQMHYLMSGG